MCNMFAMQVLGLAAAFMEPRLGAVDQDDVLWGDFFWHGGRQVTIQVQSERARKPTALTQVNF